MPRRAYTISSTSLPPTRDVHAAACEEMPLLEEQPLQPAFCYAMHLQSGIMKSL